MKFKCRKHKHRVLVDKKIFQNKSEDLSQLRFTGKLLVSNKSEDLSQLRFTGKLLVSNKSEDLSQLRFSGKLLVSKSMCYKNHRQAYKCL